MEEKTQLPKEDNNIPLTVEIVDLVIDMLSADASRARMEKEILKLLNRSAYATKLHQAKEVIKELERQNEKMKSMATGWRPLLEDILRDNNNGYIDIDEALCSRIKKFLYGE